MSNGRTIMSDGSRRMSDSERSLREAKVLAKEEQVDVDVALTAIIGAQHTRSLFLILDTLKEIRDFQDFQDV